MKPREANVQIDYNDDDERELIEMEIDEEGLPALIGLLTGIYNDPALAVIREYTTNAIDANIESGTENYVEVTLPSELGEPEFIVSDYGPGMGPEEVRDTYSKYVKSTKRQSNDVAGMFGIGSKSALAYTGQFTVRSVRNGIASAMTFSRKSGAPEIELKTYKTDEPSGTTVKVPVKNRGEFNHKAREHYKMLKKGLVLVDGEDLGGQHRQVDLGGGVYTTDLKANIVVMGNVPYELPRDVAVAYDSYGGQRNMRKTRTMFIFEVPLGKFMPAPPREGLELNDDDKKLLKNMIIDADVKYRKHITRDFDNATTIFEAVDAVVEANRILSHRLNLERTIDGSRISSYGFTVPNLLWDHNKYERGSSKYSTVRQIDNTRFVGKRITFFYNADDTLSDYYHKKVTDWCLHEGIPVNYYAFKKKSEIPSGYPKELIKDFNEVKNWSRPTTRKSGTTKSGKWREVTSTPHRDNWNKSRTPFNWRTTQAIDVDSHGSRTLLYVSPSDVDRGVTLPMLEMATNEKDVCLISLGKNRWAKFADDYPKSQHIKDWYEVERKNKIAGLTQDHFRDRAHALPDLDSKLHRRYNERVKKINALRKEAANKVGPTEQRLLGTGPDPELTKLRDEIEKRYPYAPVRRYYAGGGNLKQANVYIKAMDMYYKEMENDSN